MILEAPADLASGRYLRWRDRYSSMSKSPPTASGVDKQRRLKAEETKLSVARIQSNLTLLLRDQKLPYPVV